MATIPPTTPPATLPAWLWGLADFDLLSEPLDSAFEGGVTTDTEVVIDADDVGWELMSLSENIFCKAVKFQPPSGSVRLKLPFALYQNY